MIITEVMAPQVPDINDKTWERLREHRSESSSKVLRDSSPQIYVGFRLISFLLFYLFILSRDLCESLALYTVYSKNTQCNFVAYV